MSIPSLKSICFQNLKSFVTCIVAFMILTSEGLCESMVDEKPINHSEKQKKTFNFHMLGKTRQIIKVNNAIYF
jgi:hypothetical protein